LQKSTMAHVRDMIRVFRSLRMETLLDVKGFCIKKYW